MPEPPISVENRIQEIHPTEANPAMSAVVGVMDVVSSAYDGVLVRTVGEGVVALIEEVIIGNSENVMAGERIRRRSQLITWREFYYSLRQSDHVS